MFIREDVPSQFIESQMRIKGFFVELYIKRKKWLLCFSYNPKFSHISFYLNELGKNLDTLTSKYDKIIVLGDFNTEPTDTALFNFCENFNLKNLIKNKNDPNKPSCFDLIITNRPKCFQNFQGYLIFTKYVLH